MGSHRADPRAGRRRSTAREETTTAYVGKRIAGREATSAPVAEPIVAESIVAPVAPVAQPVLAPQVTALDPVARRAASPRRTPLPSAHLMDRAPTVELPALGDIAPADPLTDSSTSQLRAIAPSGKRRAVRHAGSRGPLFKSLPTMPVAVGVATLAIAVGGVVVSSDPQLASSAGDRLTAPNAMTGSFGTATQSVRVPTVSRDSDRDTLAQATGVSLEAEARRHDVERTSALGELAKDAEKEAAEIALNRWVLPLASYRLTATFGEYGLWSSYHTGLDFAAPSGTPIRAVTNGVVTSAGSDGAYGNKTVLTLDDGTELWFCHQTSFAVSTGDKVRAGEIIGYVGSTGHVTGPHLHLEVRPGGGDPVDPDAALRVHGVTP